LFKRCGWGNGGGLFSRMRCKFGSLCNGGLFSRCNAGGCCDSGCDAGCDAGCGCN
jgi:hypothetical protein